MHFYMEHTRISFYDVVAPKFANYHCPQGFVLQALQGEGDVFLKAGGTLIRRDLEPGEELRISSGCLVGFSEGVNYGKNGLE